jgi:uncharacterized protein (DUF952 family)
MPKPLFHILTAEAYERWDTDAYAPPSLATEGFIHASYREAVEESARLYFPADARLMVMRIDPRKLDVRVEDAVTPRGPMPHIFGPIPREAVDSVVALGDLQ